MATVDAALILGFQHHQAGRLGEAETLYRQVLQAAPDHPDALHLLGVLARANGRFEEAVALIGRSIRLRPTMAEPYYNYGNALQALGRLEEAAESYRRSLELKPTQLDAAKNLGNLLQNLSRLDEAIAVYRKALEIHPDCATLHNNIAAALQMQGRVEAAVAAYRLAIQADSGYAEAHNNLGLALMILGRSGEAEDAFRQALAIRPDYPECYSNMGNVLYGQGRIDEAIACYRRALELRPDFAEALSNLLIGCNYQPGIPVDEVFARHREFDERFGRPLAAEARRHTNHPDPERRLRIGYYSPDFRRHSCAFFFMPLVEQRDRSQVEVFCYAHLKNPDDYSERIRRLADHWIAVTGLPDPVMAERIRADGIDIMVDMAGHFADHRLQVFARKPAPVQVTWLGYPNTTGLSAIDYRLTDAWADPEGDADRLHSETLVRLPRGFICYTPPDDAPAVTAPPVLASATVTFGSFNNSNKITPDVIALWAMVLHRVPGARLLLKSIALGDPQNRQRFLRCFATHGIDAGRVEILPWTNSPTDHMPLYGRIDIALDPFPYNGTTTTCEALWMGVPVVALAGDRHAGRVGISLLTRAGLAALVARTPEDYVAIAAALAANPAQLAALRAGMRDRLCASPLCDAAGYARQVEDAYRAMWRHWCRRAPE